MDVEPIPLNTTVFYLTTGVTSGGVESDLGFGLGVLRPNDNSCP